MDSLLVLTGYSTREDVETHPCRPTHIASDLADWLGRIGG
jgi:4-nitrophenyl phosphatase